MKTITSRTATALLALVGVALLGGGLLADAAPAVAQTAAAQPIRVQYARIVDHKGFEKPMLAAGMMVPAGWRHEGQVEWQIAKRCGDAQSLRLRAQAPDGSAAIELVPGEAWAMSSMGMPVGDCVQASFRSNSEYLQAWVRHFRPGARWIDYTPRPDKSRARQRHDLPMGALTTWIESGQALIGYNADGREMREVIVANVAFTHSILGGMAGGGSVQSLHGQSLGVLSWRAPAGTLDLHHFDLVWNTFRTDPQWRARIAAGNAQMAQENARTQIEVGKINAETSRQTLAEIAKRGEIQTQTRNELANIQNGIYANRNSTNDRMHTENVKAIREVERYAAPYTGGTVDLPNHYRHAWQLKDGSYFLTDNPNFQPNRDLGIAGEPMKTVR